MTAIVDKLHPVLDKDRCNYRMPVLLTIENGWTRRYTPTLYGDLDHTSPYKRNRTLEWPGPRIMVERDL